MRKLLPALSVLFFVPVAGAQHTVHLGMGLGSGAAQRTSLAAPFEWNDVYHGQPHGYVGQWEWPTFFFQADVDMTRNLSLGVHYNHWQEERWVKGGNEGSSFWNSVNTYMFGARWSWNGHDRLFEFYSGGMLGASFRHLAARGISDGIPVGGETFMAHQVTLLGMRWGRRVGFTMEIGEGYKGTVCAGLSIGIGKDRPAQAHSFRPFMKEMEP